MPAFYVAIIGIERSLDQNEGVRVGPQKFWLETWIEPEHILVDENLPADARAGAHAVKLEGVRGHAEIVRHIVESGVPVWGISALRPNPSTCLVG